MLTVHTQQYTYGSSQTVGPLRAIVQCSHVKADRIASRSLPTEDGLCFFPGHPLVLILILCAALLLSAESNVVGSVTQNCTELSKPLKLFSYSDDVMANAYEDR
ncbi:uncharacterized protein BP01DRAFT_379892 [Aspergillus saccharolyticus JOP 1030-1]|uniref:Uncharacterized protein n=1 Tax=Aspergillus saccharolyticus JOP 1030-1 TaxID=1450539 RepID=A0A318ZN99_9EURO|nr:hypothetical protein BP01DRAFT_379892 [Aspergillus saccharolyticus JOP 1030-1]PYH47974.1 hypothetical protein BP01DRAFT_379892 [Aspergillus saccharolyticus JOP 1030-1]